MESRLARRLFLPCRLITSCKHPSRGESVKNARDEIFFLSVFFFLLFIFSFTSYFIFFFAFFFFDSVASRNEHLPRLRAEV